MESEGGEVKGGCGDRRQEGLAAKASELSWRVAWVKCNALVCVKSPQKGSALRHKAERMRRLRAARRHGRVDLKLH